MNEKKTNYKDTLNLPKTSFPMRAGLPQKEPIMLKKWEKEELYKTIIAERESSGKKYILHDGPPYANGHIHMGHVLNKILKDMCVKYKTMRGYRSPYVPGWDCHGLPVEHQLFKELEATKDDISQVEFRKKAYKYAMKYVRIQAKEFKRLGIFGEWDDPYLTLTKGYESDILFSLADLYEKGYIYKGLKPVNWCKTCETALAEAEVEYEEKKSPSIYVRFPVEELTGGKKTSMVIWTTTPWTLLANVAVAVQPTFEYSFVATADEVLVMVTDLVEPLMAKFDLGEYSIVESLTGAELSDRLKKASHPFIDRESAIVCADYVTKDEGTGCVHTAPGHGQDDYITGKKYDLPVIMPVNQKGAFKDEAGEFAGMDVLSANPQIVDKLRSVGSLLEVSDIIHSYPHCWRCKSPVIFRATEQWFMSIDHDDLRKKMEQVINNDVAWVPEAGKDRISAMVKNRPDWCLSRQRYWGVPIPAFQCNKCDLTVTNADIISNVAKLTKESGADIWFESEIKDLLPDGMKCADCGCDDFRKEEDILDVWFDSGVSHRAVLDAREHLGSPCDLYLEGSDQHRGWFQAALITSMGMNGRAPYKSVLTHGFVVDGDGKKMSKSLGNVISPEDVMKQFGADILRLWVSSSDYNGDIKISSEILARLADGYRKMRNTFRYLLSNLFDFDPQKDAPEYDQMPEADRWMLSRLFRLMKETTAYYDSYEFYKVYRAVYDFCVFEVSSFYLDASKDILYVQGADSPERRSAQTVLFHILNTLVRIMAPILSFTTEEVWENMSFEGKEKSVHLAPWKDTDSEYAAWENEVLDTKWDLLLGIRDSILKVLEERREAGVIGSSLDARLSVFSDDDGTKRFLEDCIDLFPLIFRVSQAITLDAEEEGMLSAGDGKFKIKVGKALGEKCPRCWNYYEETGMDADHPGLCSRCTEVMIKRR